MANRYTHYRFMFNFTALNLVLPVRIDTWNTFNSQKQISQYDATFVWWDWAFATLLKAAARVLGANSTTKAMQTLKDGLAKSICSTATMYCNGTNAQYKSAHECEQYLTKEIRFGSPYELGRSYTPYEVLRDVSCWITDPFLPVLVVLANHPSLIRTQYPHLPHGTPEHGPLPAIGALSAHRQDRWGVLYRQHELRRHSEPALLHELPLYTVRQIKSCRIES